MTVGERLDFFLELNFVGVVPVVTLRLCSWSRQEPQKKNNNLRDRG